MNFKSITIRIKMFIVCNNPCFYLGCPIVYNIFLNKNLFHDIYIKIPNISKYLYLHFFLNLLFSKLFTITICIA